MRVNSGGSTNKLIIRGAGKMARKTNLSIEELISAKEQEISNLSDQLKNAKAELKELQEKKTIEDSRNVMEAIAASGKSIEEVLAMINNQ